VKLAEIRGLTADELENKIRDSKKELFNLRLQQVSGRIENPARIRLVRRDIARMMTVLREQASGKSV
jgi:large subunit ribosomal protein L29